MRILLTEGSGLTSRQVATRLGELSHQVEILSSAPLCLARFTKHVRKVHPVPRFGAEPLAWMEAAAEVCLDRAIDILFPTQEQATVISAMQAGLPVRTVVPAFASLRAVQDKLSAFRSLAEAGVPQPRTWVIESEQDFGRIESYPVFLKRPVGTASAGVRRTKSKAEAREAARALGAFRRRPSSLRRRRPGRWR